LRRGARAAYRKLHGWIHPGIHAGGGCQTHTSCFNARRFLITSTSYLYLWHRPPVLL
jgi:hypothetical protein